MLSVGILSHYAPLTLHNTLTTYKNHGLLDLSDDIFVVIQFSSRQEKEKSVCDTFGIRSICLPDNGKMAWGFKMIYENAKYEYLLFLENDFIIKEDAKNFINNCLYFLKEKNIDIVRGRSRINPGVPNYAYLNLRNIPPQNFMHSLHLSECIYWVDDPEKIYSTISRIDPKYGEEKWYKTTSRHCNYTNNPYACSKEFFKTAILPYIEFGKNLETEITSIWSKNDYKCVFGPGLFTHDRSYDGHI